MFLIIGDVHQFICHCLIPGVRSMIGRDFHAEFKNITNMLKYFVLHTVIPGVRLALQGSILYFILTTI